MEKKSEKRSRRNSEDILNRIFDNADNFGIIATDENKVITFFNKGAERILGYKREEIVGKETPMLFHHEEEISKIAKELSRKHGKVIRDLEIFAENMEQSGLDRHEWTYKRKDGRQINVELTVTPLTDDSGKITGALGIFYDITDKKRLEEEFQSYKIQSSGIIAYLPEPTFAIDLEGRVTAWNHAIENMTGIPASEILGKGNYQYAIPFYGKRRPMLIDMLKLPDKELKKWEYRGLSKSGNVISVDASPYKFKGKIYYIKANASPVYDNDGRIIGAIESVLDVTAIKNTENALRESEAKFRGISDRSSDIIMFTDTKGKITDISPSTFKILGYKPEEMIGRGPEEFIMPEDLEEGIKNIGRSLNGENIDGFEVRLQKKDLGVAIVDLSATPITENGILTGIQVISRDITDKKRSQERILGLLEKEKELMDIINRSPVVAFLWKAEENWPVEKVSENISQFAYTADDFTSGRIIFSSIIHPDDLERVASEVEYNSENKIDEFIQTYRIFGKDKTEYWIDDFTRIRRNEKGEITHYQGIIMDISSRKKAEEALAVEKAKTENIIDSLPGIFYIFSETGNLIRWNKNFETWTGYSAEQIRKTPALNFIDERYREQVALAIKAAFIDGYGEVEGALVTKDGKKIPMFLSGYAKVIDNVPYLLGTGVDITAAKEAKQEIQRLAAIVQNSGEMVAMTDVDGYFTFINKAGAEMLGIDINDISKHKVFEVLTDDQKEKVNSEVLPSMKERGSWEGELQYRNFKSGEIVDVHAMTFNINDPDTGKPLFLANVSLDITEKKRAKKALAREKANVEYIIDSLPGMFYMFYMFDSTGKFVRWNKNLETLTGYSAEEVQDMRPLEFIEDNYKEQISDAIKTAFLEGYADLEAVIITKGGKKIPFFFSANRKVIEGRPYILGMGLDITKAKQTEEEIRKLASVVKHSGEMIALTSPEGTINFMNEAGAKMIGVSENDITRYHFMDFIPEHLKDKMNSEVLPTMAEKGLWEGDLQYINKKNIDLVDVHAMTFTIKDPETGAPAYLANVSLNISDRKKAEAALKEVNKKLNLLGSITRHDILNQITVAQGYLEILEMDGKIPENTETEEFYIKIRGAVDTIRRQILFTKDYKDLGEQSPEWYNVGRIIENNYINSGFQTIGLVNETDDLEIYADPLFERVIYNLFDNAVKHGEKITTIKFFFRKSGNDMELICEDDGAGVPEDVKEKIFKREYYKHTGLGLFLSKEILSITGLSIKENGTFGKGARFVIDIPKGLFRFREEHEKNKIN